MGKNIIKEKNAYICITESLTRPPYLSLEKPVCRSRSNSLNWTWNNGLVQNWERSTQGCMLSPLFNLNTYLLNIYFNLNAEYIM